MPFVRRDSQRRLAVLIGRDVRAGGGERANDISLAVQRGDAERASSASRRACRSAHARQWRPTPVAMSPFMAACCSAAFASAFGSGGGAGCAGGRCAAPDRATSEAPSSNPNVRRDEMFGHSLAKYSEGGLRERLCCGKIPIATLRLSADCVESVLSSPGGAFRRHGSKQSLQSSALSVTRATKGRAGTCTAFRLHSCSGWVWPSWR